MRVTWPWLSLLALPLIAAPGAAFDGLTAGPGGTLLRHGQPYRAFGVNYYSGLNRALLAGPEDTSYEAGLAVLADHQIPFARCSATPYWPNEWQLYQRDPDEYFRRFDRFVAAAERHHVGLILSLFWHQATVSDLCGEPRGAWGDPASLTTAFVQHYTREVVSRYVNSPAIWAWEVGNEFNLSANLPNRAGHRPPVVPGRGTPTRRSEADDVTTAILQQSLRTVAETIRSLDPDRLISSGHAVLRPSAFHQARDNAWTRDSRAEHQEMLAAFHPDPLDLLSVHLYDIEPGQYFADEPLDTAGLLDALCDMSAALGKPLLVGEFGAHGEHAAEETRALLEILGASRVPLAAVWVFDRGPHDPFNITADNDLAWVLDRLRDLNQQVQATG